MGRKGPELEEREWAAAACSGDEQAFYQLISIHRRKLYGIAYSYLRNEADALEAIQETVCKAWIKCRRLKDPEVVPGKQSIEVRLYMHQSAESKIAMPYRVEDHFTDDKGNTYRILSENDFPSYRLDDDVETISFKLESRQYSQPLNFTLTETLDYKPQQFKIPLK